MRPGWGRGVKLVAGVRAGVFRLTRRGVPRALTHLRLSRQARLLSRDTHSNARSTEAQARKPSTEALESRWRQS